MEYAFGKTVKGAAVHICPNFMYRLKPKHMLSIVRDRLQQLECSFGISHAINNDYTFVTSGLLEVL